jgi:hypothetical protein
MSDKTYLDKDGYQTCAGCDYPVPREYCWDARDKGRCALGFPARWELKDG